jgi:hypothetical protein
MRVLGLAFLILCALTGQAQARRESSFSYGFTRVWNTAVRLVRIDFGSAITEKDKDSGYFLFEFTDGAKQHAGSLELIRLQDGGVESVRVIVQIAALPAYVEQNLLDRLTRKLSAEYGPPMNTKSSATKVEGGKPEAGEGASAQPPGKPQSGQEASGKAGSGSEPPRRPTR